MADEDQAKVLAEIRDVLREQLSELNRLTAETLENQRLVVTQQEKMVKVSKQASGAVAMFALVVGMAVGAVFFWYFSRTGH